MVGGGGNDFVAGQAGNDKVFGGGGRDTIVGGSGNDTLKGGGGADTFRFTANHGSDKLRGFQQGIDQIEIIGASRFSDLDILQSGRNVRIEFGNLEILLNGQDVSDFGASDFIF